MVHLCERDKASLELRDRKGIEASGSVLKRNRLEWFGRVERKNKEDWVRKCMYMEVEGARPRGRPRKTWLEMVKNDMNGLGLASGMLWTVIF